MTPQEIFEAVNGYLPYQVGIKVLNYKSDYVGVEYSHINGHYLLGENPHYTYKDGKTGKSFFEMRILLRPLSDLLDIDNELRYDLMDIMGLASIDFFLEALINKEMYVLAIDKYPAIYEFFHKNHFDWKDDLIGKGVALNLSEI